MTKQMQYVWVSFVILFIFMKLAKADNYIVHMDFSVMPKAFSNQQSWYLATLSSVSAKSIAKTSTAIPLSKLIYTYNHVIQGFSASLTPEELEALKNAPGYVSSDKDRSVKVDTTHSFKFLGLNSGTGAWPVSNFGKDVIIGVIDTGVWPESESFNDNGMTDVPSRWKGACESGTQFNSSLCNKKLIGARSFNKGLIAQNPNITISMNSPRDTEGHGTHTSSTAAGTYVEDASFFGYATGTARGTAPGARVAMYKALWEEGAYTTDIIAAIDQAITDGVDVLSMSLGLDGLELYEDPIAIATFTAIDKNIFVSTSAGNEGPDVETLHNGTPWVLTVAAGTMDRDFGATLTLGGKGTVNGLALYPGNFSSSEFPIVFMDACGNTTELRKIKQKIVVCQDPGKEDSLNDQFNNVQVAGNTAGVFITNNSNVDIFEQSPFPAIFLEQKDGDTVVDFIKTNTDPKASVEFKKTILGIKPSPRVTSYTSRGPSYSCPSVLKPDIMAPGDSVLAAWPTNIGAARVNEDLVFSNFNLLSGTSMACPHVSGIAALLKAVYPDWSPAAIRSALMTTSDQIDNTGSPIKDIGDNLRPANPLAMGAGHINPNKALDPGLVYDATVQDYVNLLCGLNFTAQQLKTITKSSSNNCSNPSLDLNYPSFIAFFNDRGAKPNSTTVLEFHRTVTNVGDASSTYKANVTPVNGLKVTVEPDILVFKAKYEKKSFKLSVEGPRQLNEAVSFGYLTWEDNGRKHVVRSPIVATSYKIEK
ncbi:Subtilisin-like protease 1.9 [Hibiscus trionum]|uniref:Subtilisin-like protease 1.9 n=1 Tax=Hibiscus trionum TaxID=183268 RepID=A0A9W7JKP0_HIBTR|nr:Subtilisin-like protease 1.9 [Hibiscus trionum]